MRLKAIVASVVLAAFCMGASAQEAKENPWFIYGQLGASYSTGDAQFGKLIAPQGAIGFGKYFNPVWGARLSISGWRGRVGSEVTDLAHGFYYGAATVDGMMNLSQLIRRYPERLFDVNVIAGIGFNRAFTNVSSFMGRAGLQGAFRLNDALDFNVELMANGVSDRWNGRNDHSIDTYFNLGLGLTYKFGTGFKCATCISTEYPTKYYSEDEINRLVNELREQKAAEHRTDTVVVRDTVTIGGEKVVRGIRGHVSFGLNQTTVASSQEVNIIAIADYMKQYPDSKATITGYADNGTGTQAINQRLARQRAESVADVLVNKYGIERSRLTVSSMKDREQPFQTNDWNRVVIMIAD